MDKNKVIGLLEALELFDTEKLIPKEREQEFVKLFNDAISGCRQPVNVSTKVGRNVMVLVNGYNVVREFAEVDVLSFAETVNKFCNDCSPVPVSSTRIIAQEITNIDINESYLCKTLDYISRLSLSHEQFDNFLSNFIELYSKRESIETIKSICGTNHGSPVKTEDLRPFIDVYKNIKGTLTEDQVTKSSLVYLGLAVPTLRDLDGNKLFTSIGNICIASLTAFVKENMGTLNSDFVDCFYKSLHETNRKAMTATDLLNVVPEVSSTADHLRNVKHQNDIQIVNIIVETGLDTLSNPVKESIAPHSLMGQVLRELQEVELEKSIKRYGNLTTEIEPRVVFNLSHSERTSGISTVEGADGGVICFVAKHLNLEIVCKDKDTSEIVLLRIVKDGEVVFSPSEFKTSTNKEDRCPTLSITRLKLKSPAEITYNKENEITNVQEGLKFSEDGGIKLTYQPKTSYMDEYAKAHKIIHANSKAGNFEAMKSDLAFLFAFINHIESQVIYSGKPVSTSKREDAIKARMFAINDFKTYMKIVQKNEPNFDFTKYFETMDKGKVLVEFTNSEIRGIRKLLRTILNA